MEQFFGFGVLGLLIYQQWFYTRLVKDLVSRLMARDLRDFETSKNPPAPRVVQLPQEPVEDFDRIIG